MAEIANSYLEDLKHDGDFSAKKNGDIRLISGLDNLKQALYHRLVTVPGALVHRPEYGVGIQNWQNDIASIERQRELAKRIKEQFELDERVVQVKSVQVLNIKENGTFEVKYIAEASGEELVQQQVNPF